MHYLVAMPWVGLAGRASSGTEGIASFVIQATQSYYHLLKKERSEANRFLEYLLKLGIGRGADNSHYVQ
jgi:hypothetical protein